MILKTNPELDLANFIISNTGINLFLTGKAGTGKTTFLKQLKESSPKRMVIVAPTGVAAINAGGVTIHSLFQLNFGPFVPNSDIRQNIYRFRKEKLNIIQSLDLLVIDEISMVRSDLLDYVDTVLRYIRRSDEPFGGVQLLMIGDMQQLSPVTKDEEWALLSNYYSSPYFFSSNALQKSDFACVELKTIYRQEDNSFINILNAVRSNNITQDVLDELNKRYKPKFNPKEKDGYIRLTTHNNKAQEINNSKLKKLKSKSYFFNAKITGDFPESSFPTDEKLELKKGEQVMFIKNDSHFPHRYYNGKIGIITELDEKNIKVKCENETEIDVSPEKWDNIKYEVNKQTKELEEHIEGSFEQYPLKSAWAITVHKSQGLTFEHAILDVQDSFSHGQVYVALSRCRTLEGLVLSSPISQNSIISDSRIDNFSQDAEKRIPNQDQLKLLRINYYWKLLFEQFNFFKLVGAFGEMNRQIEESFRKLYPNICNTLAEKEGIINSEIASISSKFLNQLNIIYSQNAEPIGNEFLTERITKAADYFLNKCNNLLSPICDLVNSIETDNKDIRADLDKCISYFEDMLNIKLATLPLCKEEFNVNKYLTEKAKAVINNSSSKTKLSSKTDKTESKSKSNEKKKIVIPPDVKYKELYLRLKDWRTETAGNLGIPATTVTPMESLIAISNLLPTNFKELSKIPRLGSSKVKNYGLEIIEIVNSCIKQYGYSKQEFDINASYSSSESTSDISFRMYKNGKSIKEIAEEMNMTIGTIEGHLFKYVKLGKLNIKEISSQKRINDIKKYIKENNGVTNKEIKEHFKDKYSWSEIKYAYEEYESETGKKED